MVNYKQQAQDFLEKTDTTFSAEFVKNAKYFENDKETGDIYKITLKRGNREFVFDFGQSINLSGDGKREAPSAYRVLAGLQKYDVGSFEDFCDYFGFDTDSRAALRYYEAAKKEWLNVQILWSDSEIELLREIQ